MARCTNFLLFLTLLSVASPVVLGFRKDYKYDKETDAFYKLHSRDRNRSDAGGICKTEGATLISLSSMQDLEKIVSLLEEYPHAGDFVWINDEGQEKDPEVGETADNDYEIFDFHTEPPFDNIYRRISRKCASVTREGDIVKTKCSDYLPFVCKVEQKQAEDLYDAACDVYATGFKHSGNLTSCYKIPPMALTWDLASEECANVGAHLAVINSQEEFDFVRTLMKEAPDMPGAKLNWFYHVGYRADPTEYPVVFRTIYNETIEEVGHIEWAVGEPNNCYNMEYCGTLIKLAGTLWDNSCQDVYAFICEKEIANAHPSLE